MQSVWERFLEIIKDNIGSQIVETWFKTVTLEKWDKESKQATIQSPNQFVSKWIKDHYANLLKKHLSNLLESDEISLMFTIKEHCSPGSNTTIIPAIISKRQHQHQNDKKHDSLRKERERKKVNKEEEHQHNLNSSYTFDSFVVGPSNSLAHAASYAVANTLGGLYNPLFIYGGTGLGKTHLLHSLGNEVLAKNPKKIVQYTTSDQFVNEFINSIRFDRPSKFRNKYTKIDLLLLDDVQFFANKEQTQEAFFHVFNTLYEGNKQIVLSSDTFPKEIKGLQKRLRSRIEWGLVADIQTPNLETKIAILRKKALSQNIDISDDVSYFIASLIFSNIRELEGALIRVSAFASLTNQKITLELAKKVLHNLYSQKHKSNTYILDTILKETAKYFSVSLNEIKSKRRHKDIAFIRQISFFLMKKLSHSSLQAIGGFVGGRDHSTVIHAINKINKKVRDDLELSRTLQAIEQNINEL